MLKDIIAGNSDRQYAVQYMPFYVLLPYFIERVSSLFRLVDALAVLRCYLKK